MCGIGRDGQPRGGLLEPVALALELRQGAAVHEAVQDVGGHGGVTQVAALVLHDAVGGDDDGSAQLVALVQQGLQQLGGVLADAPSSGKSRQRSIGGSSSGVPSTTERKAVC